MKTITGQLEGHPDIELGHPRTRPIRYKLTLPDTQSIQGVILYIAGFGGDANDSYLDKLGDLFAKSHQYAFLTVDYHCFRSRINNGATIELPESSADIVRALCAQHGITFNPMNLTDTLAQIGAKSVPILIKGNLIPPDKEYQNFGVLQVLDHITVLGHLQQDVKLNTDYDITWSNLIVAGSSHGGYLAHLLFKFAPNSIQTVIDNSSYIQTPFRYIGHDREAHAMFGNITFGMSVITPWQVLNMHERSYFGIPQGLIRHTAHLPHLQECVNQTTRLPQFFCFNGLPDLTSPIEWKRRQRNRYEKMGIKAHLTEVGEEQIDGKIFKNLDHGMDASMRSLIENVLAEVEQNQEHTETDYQRETQLHFECGDSIYHFSHTKQAPYCNLEIEAV